VIAISVYQNAPQFSYYVCGILSTLSFLMVNALSKDMFDRNGYEGGICGSNGIKIWFFIGFSLGFVSIFASFAHFIHRYNKGFLDQAIIVVAQNVMIVISSILYRFGKKDSDDY
jgi:hypothetical protein